MLREVCNPLPRLGAGLTSHKERLSVWWALRWLVPEGLNVMSGPLEQTEITRHVLLEVTRSLQKTKKLEIYRPYWEPNCSKQIKLTNENFSEQRMQVIEVLGSLRRCRIFSCQHQYGYRY